jgi:hypothetical protein
MSDKKKNVKRRNVKMSELHLPVLSKNIVKEMTRYRKMTKRLMMNDYFICLNPLQRRLARTKYFEEVLDNPDWTNWSNRPTPAIKRLNLRDLDFIHCLHAPKPVRRESERENNSVSNYSGFGSNNNSNSNSGNGFGNGLNFSTTKSGNTTNYNTTCTTANLAELFNTANPFDIFSKIPQFNQGMNGMTGTNNSSQTSGTTKSKKKHSVEGNNNVTTITKTNNYSINLLPFVPIKLKTEPGQKQRFFAYKLMEENPSQINIYYYYIRDYKFLICDKSKFLSPTMTREEKESLYNTIIDSAALGIDQIINNDPYQYTEEDDKTLEELRNGELLQW